MFLHIPDIKQNMIDFVTNYLDSARQMCNVSLVSKEGNIIKSHALLLASASTMMKTMLLEVVDDDEVVVLIMPDFTEVEIKQGLDKIVREDSHSLQKSALLETLCIGTAMPKDVKGGGHKKEEFDSGSEGDLTVKDEHISDASSEAEYSIDKISSVKDFTCQFCKKTFSTQKRLTCHVSIEHELKPSSMNSNRYDGQVGDLDKDRDENLTNINEEEEFWCDFCTRKFLNESTFRNHMWRKHQDNNDYFDHIEQIDGQWVCKICGVTNPKKNGCVQHWRKVHNKEKSKITCDVCNKELANKWNLKLHMKIHTGNRDFICDACGTGFLDKKQLKNHRVRLHGSDQEKALKRNHVCSTCGKGFWNKTSLTTHEDVHLEGHNFICDQCEATFKTSNALRIHTNRIHLGKWVLTEEQREKQNLRKRKFRADKKARNGGMLRTPEEKAVFNEYMRNYMARRKAAAKDTVVRQLNM